MGPEYSRFLVKSDKKVVFFPYMGPKKAKKWQKSGVFSLYGPQKVQKSAKKHPQTPKWASKMSKKCKKMVK